MSATPRPWNYSPELSDAGWPRNEYVRDVNHNAVVAVNVRNMADECIANAELIVRAVNSHDALVEALKEMLALTDSLMGIIEGAGLESAQPILRYGDTVRRRARLAGAGE